MNELEKLKQIVRATRSVSPDHAGDALKRIREILDEEEPKRKRKGGRDRMERGGEDRSEE